jgi:hypothetical protein
LLCEPLLPGMPSLMTVQLCASPVHLPQRIPLFKATNEAKQKLLNFFRANGGVET